MAVCGFAVSSNSGDMIVITGSEDTFLKVSYFHMNELKPMQTFSNHIASIRSISKLRISPKESKQKEYLILSAGSRM